jgi:hypothetical protein
MVQVSVDGAPLCYMIADAMATQVDFLPISQPYTHPSVGSVRKPIPISETYSCLQDIRDIWPQRVDYGG